MPRTRLVNAWSLSPAELQLARVGLAGEVDQFHVMAGGRFAVFLREAEIAFARYQRGVLLHHAADKQLRYEIEAHCRNVRRIERYRRYRLLRGKCEHRGAQVCLLSQLGCQT